MSDFRLCFCGCPEDCHDDSGRCIYCSSDDCGGFTYDEEGTIMALVEPPPDVQ